MDPEAKTHWNDWMAVVAVWHSPGFHPLHYSLMSIFIPMDHIYHNIKEQWSACRACVPGDLQRSLLTAPSL